MNIIQPKRASATTANGTGRKSEFVTASTAPSGCGGSLIHLTKPVWTSAAPGCSANQYDVAITSTDTDASTQDVTGPGTADTPRELRRSRAPDPRCSFMRPQLTHGRPSNA